MTFTKMMADLLFSGDPANQIYFAVTRLLRLNWFRHADVVPTV